MKQYNTLQHSQNSQYQPISKPSSMGKNSYYFLNILCTKDFSPSPTAT